MCKMCLYFVVQNKWSSEMVLRVFQVLWGIANPDFHTKSSYYNRMKELDWLLHADLP